MPSFSIKMNHIVLLTEQTTDRLDDIIKTTTG